MQLKLSTYLIYVLLSFSCCNAVAQQKNEKIYSSSLNKQFLEHIIKEKIDSVRKGKGLKLLVNDSILYIAANYHANWMNDNRKFSHKEKTNPIMLTPQDRVNHFGAPNYLVGENIIKTYLNKPLEREKVKPKNYINKTYEDLANDFVIGWINSPKHYANILTEDYQITGLAISVNPKKDLIYAVQKFASVPFKYEFSEPKGFFNYSNYETPIPVNSFDEVSRKRLKKKYPWKIKAPKSQEDSTKRCTTCNTVVDERVYKDYWIKKGSSLILHSNNADALESIIKKRKDGLAIEFIAYKPYDCGNPEYYTKPSRRNNQSILSDTVIKPLYRRQLKKGFKKATYSTFFKFKKRGTSEYFELKLGKMPKDLGGYYEINLIVLQKKKVCRVIHFTDFCGEDLLDYYRPVPISFAPDYEYIREPSTGKVSFTVPFEKAKYDYKMEDIAPLLGTMSNVSYTVDRISIDAFSSLEGSEDINKKLQLQRANSILQVFQNKQTKEVKSTISYAPNWDVFQEQIKTEKNLNELKTLTTSEIKKRLENKEFNASIERYLSKQRYAKIQMDITFDLTDEMLADTLLKDFQRTVKYYNITKLNSSFDSLLQIQHRLYELSLDKLTNIHHWNSMAAMIGDNDDLLEDYYWYQIELTAPDSTELSKFYSKKWFKIESKNYWQTHYADLRLQIDRVPKYGFFKDENGKKLMSKLNYITKASPKGFTAKADSLELYGITTFISYYLNDPTLKSYFCNLLLNKVIDLNYTEEEVYVIAQFFLKVEEEVLAYSILNWKNVSQGFALDKSKILFAKLGYYHNKEFHNNVYHQSLIDMFETVSNESWCEMFVGPCNTSFQVFDYEPLRIFYCEKCGSYPNYAQKPDEW